MQRRSYSVTLTMVLPMCLSGCGLFGGQPEGLAQVDDLVTWIERVHVESELSREQVRQSMQSLRTLAMPGFEGDAVTAYADFVASIDRSEAQAKELRATFAPMQDAAEPVFEEWQDSLDKFRSDDMRRRSQARYDDTRERYEALVAAIDPALDAYDTFNGGLRDHALFLGHDFNPASVSAIQDDLHSLDSQATGLDDSFGSCLDAARAYLASAAPPVRQINTAEPQR